MGMAAGGGEKSAVGYVVYEKPDDAENIRTEIYSGDRIIRAESFDYLRSVEKVDAEFAKLYLKSADMLSRNENISETGFRICLRLLQYIRFDTGLVAYSNGEPISIAGVKRICADMGERTVERAIDELCKQDVYIKASRYNKKELYLIVNPYVFMRGAKANKTLTKLFAKSEWAALYSGG